MPFGAPVFAVCTAFVGSLVSLAVAVFVWVFGLGRLLSVGPVEVHEFGYLSLRGEKLSLVVGLVSISLIGCLIWAWSSVYRRKEKEHQVSLYGTV